MSEYLSVSSLTKYLKLKFDKDPYLERVYLTGQVSNFRKRPNHQYFSLKDEKAVIQATVWAGIYKSFGFELEEGMKINVIGRIQLYEPSGSYSIVIEKAEPDGVGALAIQFEQLKKKLQEEGLFQEKLKQAIPQFSNRIGVLTVRVELLSRYSYDCHSAFSWRGDSPFSNQGTRRGGGSRNCRQYPESQCSDGPRCLDHRSWWWVHRGPMGL